MTLTPETLRQHCKPGRWKCLKHFVSPCQKRQELFWCRADYDLIHPCPLQLFQTPRIHVQIPIRAQNQSPRKRPKLSLTSLEATWNQSRPISPSTPIPRCYCFPMDIHQNCHGTMRTWYVEKNLQLCTDCAIDFHEQLFFMNSCIMFKEFHILIPKERTNKVYLKVYLRVKSHNS